MWEQLLKKKEQFNLRPLKLLIRKIKFKSMKKPKQKMKAQSNSMKIPLQAKIRKLQNKIVKFKSMKKPLQKIKIKFKNMNKPLEIKNKK